MQYHSLFHDLCHHMSCPCQQHFSPSLPVPTAAFPTGPRLPHQTQLQVGFGFPFSTMMSLPYAHSLMLTSSLSTFRQGSMHSHCPDPQKCFPLLAIPACLNHILPHHMAMIPARLHPCKCTQLLPLHCRLLYTSTSESNPREMISQPSASFYHMLTADHFCYTTVFFILSDLGFTRK